MQTSKILNTVQSHIVFHKSLFGDDDRNFKGTSLNVSPLQVIEEFETFNEFSLGPLQKMLVQKDRIEVIYKHAILLLTW